MIEYDDNKILIEKYIFPFRGKAKKSITFSVTGRNELPYILRK